MRATPITESGSQDIVLTFGLCSSTKQKLTSNVSGPHWQHPQNLSTVLTHSSIYWQKLQATQNPEINTVQQ